MNRLARLGPLALSATLLVGCGAGELDPGIEEGDEFDERSSELAHYHCGTRALTGAEVARIEGGLGTRRAQAFAPLAPGSVTVPVWVHVIRDSGGAGDIPDSRIKAQINVLNNAYGGLTGGLATRTPFRFQLAGIDRTNNSSWYTMTPDSAAEAKAKAALRRGDPKTLNLYFANIGGGLLGWATFPWEAHAAPLADGVVLLSGSEPGGAAAPYNQGATATHEVGHWLGLYHTFQGGCSRTGDSVGDTPAQRYPTSGCPSRAVDSCTGSRYTGLDPVHNFMDYADDGCMYELTPGQSSRADAAWQSYR